MKIANYNEWLSDLLNMTWNPINLGLYEDIEDKLRDSDALFFKIFQDFLKNYPMLLGKVFQIAKKDVVHRNVKILSQKHPELISLYARHMTKDQILHFIKTNKPSILEKLNISKYVNFYDTDNSILDDIDVQIALYPSIPNLVLKNLDKNNPKAILQLGKAINWDTKLYSIIPNIERESVREYIVNSSAFPKDFREKIQGKTENIDRIEQDSDDIDDSDELKVNIQQREKEYAYLFRKNIHKLALRLYNGKKKSVLDLFNLYSNIVDIRSNTFSSTLKQSFNTWKTILKEQSKYFTPDEKITTEIGLSLRTIENFLKTHKEIDLKDKTELYKTSRYKNLVDNFVSYMVSFFAHLEIKVKPLPIVSDISGIRIIVLTTDSKEDPIAQQLSLVNQMKNKLTEVFLSKLSLKPGEEIEKEYSGVPYYETSKGFVSLETIKTYSSLGELLEGVKKHKIIDKNYSNLVLNQGKIINPNNNKVIGNITYLDSNTLQQKIDEYQSKIDDYNSNLKSYETPLTNDPKTIQVGDHLFNVVKILDKNLSRLVVIEGEYAGHFVDELVSTTGEVIGSKTKASPYLIETSRGMKELSLQDKNINGITNNKPFETFKKLNGIKDSSLPVDFINKIDREYLNSVAKIVYKYDITSDEFHKLTGLNIASNIPTVITSIVNDYSENIIFNTINLKGLGFIERKIYLQDNGEPDYISNDYFAIEKCIPDGLGSRVFTQQVKTASEMGFKYIKTTAAKGGGYVGYYVWPKLGYDKNIILNEYIGDFTDNRELIKYEYLKKWLIKNNIDPEGEVPLSAIYACKAGNRFVGQELWYEIGGEEKMEFDLTPGSLSMRILESYINLKSKKDNIDPSEFLKIDYSKYKSLDLECYLEKGGNSQTVLDSVLHNVKNYENGAIERIYRKPETRGKFLKLLSWVGIDQQTKNKIQEILKHSGFENVKLANDKQLSDDPMLKELDMEILNQIWSGISKQYKQ